MVLKSKITINIKHVQTIIPIIVPLFFMYKLRFIVTSADLCVSLVFYVLIRPSRKSFSTISSMFCLALLQKTFWLSNLWPSFWLWNEVSVGL